MPPLSPAAPTLPTNQEDDDDKTDDETDDDETDYDVNERSPSIIILNGNYKNIKLKSDKDEPTNIKLKSDKDEPTNIRLNEYSDDIKK